MLWSRPRISIMAWRYFAYLWINWFAAFSFFKRKGEDNAELGIPSNGHDGWAT
ncbi:hypothetical protein OPHB3_3631 [Oceanobacillus picturae]|uniref:Uncharacterized protein n=1 Tax=Oceanobacillus picturae TaxID=171693 RepID=A0A0U9HC55_9BACI|nr:hypothetical protein OPHB3_3631 [Oceanobacillus picturae]